MIFLMSLNQVILNPMLTIQRYLSFSTYDEDSCLRLVAGDLRRVAEWCCANHLLVNPDKTKLLFGTRQVLSQLRDVTVPFLGQELKPVASVKDLGIILDSNLNFNDHVISLSSFLLSTLCQVNRVRHLFSRDVLNSILNSLVFSKYLTTHFNMLEIFIDITRDIQPNRIFINIKLKLM